MDGQNTAEGEREACYQSFMPCIGTNKPIFIGSEKSAASSFALSLSKNVLALVNESLTEIKIFFGERTMSAERSDSS